MQLYHRKIFGSCTGHVRRTQRLLVHVPPFKHRWTKSPFRYNSLVYSPEGRYPGLHRYLHDSPGMNGLPLWQSFERSLEWGGVGGRRQILRQNIVIGDHMLSASQVTESSAPLPTDFVPSLHLYMHFLPKVVPSGQSRNEHKKSHCH